jgi:hypothetical protein
MPGMTRLALACALVSTAACAAEPTRPASPLRVPSATQRSMDPNAKDDGTCKSGYTVANGRCVPI